MPDAGSADRSLDLIKKTSSRKTEVATHLDLKRLLGFRCGDFRCFR